MTELKLNLKAQEKQYKVFIDDFVDEEFKERLLEFTTGKKVVVVISDKVNKLYGHKIFSLFRHSKIQLFKFVLPDGEKHKNIKNYQRIMDFAFKCGLTRIDSIWAFGGGVVGDLAGFVASTYMRGINLVQIPTTLLACVDSSVGGKTAIDNEFGKNLIGTFYQPSAVIINVRFLLSLDEKQFKTGLGEVVKYAFIEKSCPEVEYFNLISYLSENLTKILDKDLKVLKQIVEYCVRLKISVVEKDEKESGLRKILNFGHTLGHAIEKYTHYKKYTHGEAVVQGMVFAFNLAHKLELIDENYKYSALDLISKFSFRTVKMPQIDKLLVLMKLDKKASNNEIVFVLPKEFGQVQLITLPPSRLLD